MVTMGKRLQQLRAKKQWSRRKLEQEAHIPNGIVGRVEDGQTAYPSVPVAKALAKVLGVDLNYLLGMYEDDAVELPEQEA